MRCLFLLRDDSGRLPTALDLRRCGFGVSEAVLPAQEACAPEASAPPLALALAAEARAPYGHAAPQAAEPRGGQWLDPQGRTLQGCFAACEQGDKGVPGARPPGTGGQGASARAEGGQEL